MSADFDQSALERVQRALPPDVLELARVLEAAGHRTWVVGGSLRDQLMSTLGMPTAGTADWDLATDARPRTVQRLFPKVIPTGIKHGTVTVLFEQRAYEVTTLRGEVGYSDGRRPDQVFFVDEIRADLARRDFTINAIAYDPLTGKLEDPFDGVGDLGRRMIRAVGDPLERFGEDGLRVLRAARFVATLEFELDPATAAAIRPSLGSFKKVSSERVRDEWVKTMKSRTPSRAFRIMREHGLLEMTAPVLHGPSSASSQRFELALRAVDACPPELTLRFAALLHDLGNDEGVPEPLSAEHRAARSAELAHALLQRLKFSNRERDCICALIRQQSPPDSADLSDAELRRWLRDVTPELLETELNLMTALADADGQPKARASVAAMALRVRSLASKKPPLRIADLAVTGADLKRELELTPGPIMGRLLSALLEEVLDDPARNQADVLLEAARRWLVHQARPNG